jgi:hypothetical protein
MIASLGLLAFETTTKGYNNGFCFAMDVWPRVPWRRKGRDELFRPTCYVVSMTKLLEQALRQIEQLPETEQDAAAGALLDYVKHMRDTRLTDAQVAEVRRRRADPNRKLLSHAEARERIARLGS